MILQTITESYIEDINSEYSSDLIFELDYIYSEKIIETFPNKDISFDTYSLIINIPTNLVQSLTSPLWYALALT